jgi:hypothetical protein
MTAGSTTMRTLRSVKYPGHRQTSGAIVDEPNLGTPHKTIEPDSIPRAA